MAILQVLEFFAPGTPVPQGSKVARVQGGAAVMWDGNAKKLKPWRVEVANAAREAHAGRPQLVGAVVVVLEFRFLRPKTVKRDRPFVKPDIDKTLRSIFDALTASAVIKDDAQITRVTAEKVYAAEAGVHVRVGQYIEGESK
jgi:Holliday junction resolvase RusA-like endonuclease